MRPSVPKALSALSRDGVVRLDGLFNKPLLRRIAATVRGLERAGALDRRVVRDIAGRRTSLLPFAGPFLERSFYANPRLLRLVDGMLGASARIGSLEVVWSRSGAARQYQHIDGPLRLDGRGPGRAELPAYALALATPLCDVDEENGPTAVWPGSHRAALGRRLPSEAAIRRRYREARMTGRFGFSYLYDYRTFHCGLPNHSAEDRPLLMLVFTRAWYRDPNLDEVRPRLLLSAADYRRIPSARRGLFALAPAARRELRP